MFVPIPLLGQLLTGFEEQSGMYKVMHERTQDSEETKEELHTNEMDGGISASLKRMIDKENIDWYNDDNVSKNFTCSKESYEALEKYDSKTAKSKFKKLNEKRKEVLILMEHDCNITWKVAN